MNFSDTHSTDRLESALHASLRPVDPGAHFTQALQARLAAGERGPQVGPARRSRGLYAAALPLAASMVLAWAIGWQLQALRVAERAEQARVHTQLLLALEITGDQLGQAQRRIEQYELQEHTL